jgi:hypothetical protein
VKVAALAEPEFEPTWRPDDLLPLEPPALTLRMLVERPPFRAVVIYRPVRASAARADVLDRIDPRGDDATVAALREQAIAALRASGATPAGGADFAALSLTKRRWLEGTTRLAALGLDESTIVLVHASVRAAGDRPEDYIAVAEAALGGR